MPERVTEPKIANTVCHKTGNYYIIWYERGDDGKRRPRTHSTGTKSRKAARQYLAAFLDELEVQERRRGLPTIDELAEGYLLDLLREKDARAEKSQRESLAAPLRAFAGLVPVDIDMERQREFREKRRQGAYGKLHPARSKPVTNSTLRRELGALSAALQWGVLEGRIRPDQRWPVKRPQESEPRAAYLTAEQRDDLHQRLVAVGTDNPTVRGCLLGLWCGVRRGAAFDLTWDRVDLERGLLDFRNPHLRRTRKRRPHIPCPDIIWPMIREHHPLNQPVPNLAMLETPVGGTGDLGHKMAVARKWFTSWGYPNLHFHMFRHTFATLKIFAGESLSDVAEALADTEATVEQTYRHALADRLRKTMNA